MISPLWVVWCITSKYLQTKECLYLRYLECDRPQPAVELPLSIHRSFLAGTMLSHTSTMHQWETCHHDTSSEGAWDPQMLGTAAGMQRRGHHVKYFDKWWSPVHMCTSSSYFVSRDDKNIKRLPWQENEGLSVRAKGVCMGARCFYFFVPWQLQNTKLCFQEMKSILGACVWDYVAECHLFPSQVTWGCY